MTRRRLHRDLCLAILLSAAGHAQPVPSGITGTWQVSAVLIDRGAPRTVLYGHNDPRLKGRIVRISPTSIETDLPEDKRCRGLAIVSQRTAAAALIRSTMNSRNGGKSATPEDYGLGLASAAPVDALWIRCSEGEMGPDGRDKGTWLVLLPDKRLAMRWYDESILLLAPVPEGARSNPSFDCSKAASATERAICGSISLGSFDRSIAESYATAGKRYRDDDDEAGLKSLRMSQQEWLAKRNACGANVACLLDIMESRLEALAQK